MVLDRNVNIITDLKGNKIVLINDIVFKGKRSVNWDDVKNYLETYVGEFYEIADTKAKAKANASQGIPEMLEIATGKHFRENSGEKHNRNAANGWYRYNSRFALPVYDERGEVERYNVFHASMLIRHDADGKMYLYDIMDIKKETSNPFES